MTLFPEIAQTALEGRLVAVTQYPIRSG